MVFFAVGFVGEVFVCPFLCVFGRGAWKTEAPARDGGSVAWDGEACGGSDGAYLIRGIIWLIGDGAPVGWLWQMWFACRIYGFGDRSTQGGFLLFLFTICVGSSLREVTAKRQGDNGRNEGHRLVVYRINDGLLRSCTLGLIPSLFFC